MKNKKQKNNISYSKYKIENFEEELKNAKLSFEFSEELDEDNLYWDMIEDPDYKDN